MKKINFKTITAVFKNLIKTKMFATKILTASTILCVGVAFGGWAFYHTFVKQSRKYVFANWESYMSPAVQDYLADKYDTAFVNFGNNSDLIGLYIDASYDMAVPSDYIIPQLTQRNALKTLDWSKFEGHSSSFSLLKSQEMGNYYRYKPDYKIETQYPGNNAWVPVNDNDPINLFNDAAQQFIINFKNYDNKPFNLLKYGVPYFMQDMVFVYRGPEIAELTGNNVGWSDILKQGNKFKNNIKIIDDERNIYSIGKAIETNNETINPKNSKDVDFENAYQAFKNQSKSFGNIIWDTDSQNILSYIASWKNNNAARCGIMYNGDAIASITYTQGNNTNNSNLNNWHIVRPKTTINVMDFVTMSNKISDENGAYKLIDELCLSGSNVSVKNDPNLHNSYCSIYDNKTQPAPNWNNYVKNQNSDLSTYNYLSMQNFDGVNYISPLKQFDYDDAKQYYSDYIQWGDSDIGYYLNNINNKTIEVPFTDKQQFYSLRYYADMKN